MDSCWRVCRATRFAPSSLMSASVSLLAPPSTQIAGPDPRYDELIDRAMDADRESRFQPASEIRAPI